MRLFILVPVLALVACGINRPKTATEQAKYAVDHDGAGTLDASLSPVGDRGNFADSPVESFYLYWRGVSGSKVCVRRKDSFGLAFDSAEKVEASLRRYAAATRMVVEAYDSAAAINAWPDANSGVAGTLIDSRVKNDPSYDSGGDMKDHYYLHYVIEWCPPLPAISPTTKVLAVTRFTPKSEHPVLFMWKIQGTPEATSGPATSTSPTTSTTTSPRPTATVQGTLLDAMRAEGNFDKFLEIVVAAGKEQDLAGGPLILFASYDNAFRPSILDPIVGDKARALAYVNDSIADTALTVEALISQQPVTITLRSGRKVVLTYDSKRKRVFADGKSLERQVLETNNATMFVTTRQPTPP